MLETEGVLAALLCQGFITCPGNEKSRSHFRGAERSSPPTTCAPPCMHEVLRVRRSGPKCAVSQFYGFQRRLKAVSSLVVNLIATCEVKANIFTHDKDLTLNS